MNEVSSKMLMKTVNDYIKNNKPLLEIEILDLKRKNKIYRDFNLSLEDIMECSIIQKNYSKFLLTEIQNSNGEMLGFRLVTDQDNAIYQVSSVNDREEYMIQEKNLKLMVGMNQNQKSIYAITPKTISVTCNQLYEMVVAKIYQVIENTLGNDSMKIYQIHRK